MFSRSKHLFSIFAILAMTASVYACAYSNFVTSSMHMHENNTSMEHTDHAHSLISAIIPTFISFMVFGFILMITHRYIILEPSLILLWLLIDPSPPPIKRLQQYFYNPRSPPVY